MIAAWYPRHKQARRISVFYMVSFLPTWELVGNWLIFRTGTDASSPSFLSPFSSASLSSPLLPRLSSYPLPRQMNGLTNMFGGITAYGVTFYKGTAVAHWRICAFYWALLRCSVALADRFSTVYFIMGGLAFAVGAAVLIWLPDSPSTATFLTEREKLVALEIVRDNHSGTKQKKFKPKHAKEALLDPKTWLLILLTFLSSVPNGGLSSYSSLLVSLTSRAASETLASSAASRILAYFAASQTLANPSCNCADQELRFRLARDPSPADPSRSNCGHDHRYGLLPVGSVRTPDAPYLHRRYPDCYRRRFDGRLAAQQGRITRRNLFGGDLRKQSRASLCLVSLCPLSLRLRTSPLCPTPPSFPRPLLSPLLPLSPPACFELVKS